MKRIAVFAHYDIHNVIDDYVILYLKTLKTVVEDIVFVSDCNLAESETEKIKSLCCHIIATKHGESNDFGSYKRGLAFLRDKAHFYDEIVLANDSCYCVNSFDPIFKKMSQKKCDFWGMTDNKEKGILHHLQSYLLIFRKPVFQKNEFWNFFEKIEKQEKKRSIILLYEVGLSQLLLRLGFTMKSAYRKRGLHNPSVSENALYILKKRGPLLKVEVLKSNPLEIQNLAAWKNMAESCAVAACIDHLKRIEAYDPKLWTFSETKKDSFLKRHKIFSIEQKWYSWENGAKRFFLFGVRIFKKKI